MQFLTAINIDIIVHKLRRTAYVKIFIQTVATLVPIKT